MAASASERCRIGVIDRSDPLLTSRQSNNFQNVDFSHLTFPNYLRIDYIRVYQKSGGSVGCDPSGESKAAYLRVCACTMWCSGLQRCRRGSPLDFRRPVVRDDKQGAGADLGCADYPTAAFIDKYDTVYNNPNWTVWADTGESGNGLYTSRHPRAPLLHSRARVASVFGRSKRDEKQGAVLTCTIRLLVAQEQSQGLVLSAAEPVPIHRPRSSAAEDERTVGAGQEGGCGRDGVRQSQTDSDGPGGPTVFAHSTRTIQFDHTIHHDYTDESYRGGTSSGGISRDGYAVGDGCDGSTKNGEEWGRWA
jgi:hypothetical protein